MNPKAKKAPHITRWLNSRMEEHEFLADKHENMAEEFMEAKDQWLRRGTLPLDIRAEFNQSRKESSQ